MGEFLDFSYEDFRYKLYIPSHYSPDKEFPLMVMLHGCDQNPDDFAAGTKMNELAEKENFLVLYPDMNHLFNPSNPDSYNPFGCWNWFLDKNQHRGKGHPKLINGIIEEVKSSYTIDTGMVYAAGLSAGASLACILGVTYPDVFSGIGICAGLAYDAANVVFLTDPMAESAKKSMQQGVADPYECGNSAFMEMGEFKKKMPVIVIHGICDTVVHPINGKQVIIQWAQTNYLIEAGTGKAEVNPIEVDSDFINGKSYTRHIYADGNSELLMELWMIDEMGHAWSGGSPDGSYTDPSGPNATEIIWNFFAKKQLNAELSNNEYEENAGDIFPEAAKMVNASGAPPVEIPVPPQPSKTICTISDEAQQEDPTDLSGIAPDSTLNGTSKEPPPVTANEATESAEVKTPKNTLAEKPKRNSFLSFILRLFKKSI